MNTQLGTIERFEGSWGSGMGFLVFADGQKVPCDNGPTVRALNAMFPGFIAPGHVVDNDVIAGQDVVWVWDDMGLMLGGLALLDEIGG